MSLTKKYDWLKHKLSFWDKTILPVVSVAENRRLAYREKVTLSAIFTDGAWQFGMWNRSEFIAIPECPVHSVRIKKVIACLTKVLPSYKTFPLHFLFIAEKQVTLILKTKEEPDKSWFTDYVAEEFLKAGIDALWIHLNPSAGHRMFEKTPWIHLWGKKYSADYKGFQYGPSSFHQLIPELYQQSLEEAFGFLKPDNNSLVIDLYCGIGHSMKWWAGAGASVIGIESSAEAIGCAAKNVPEAMVLRGQCHTRVKQIDKIINENNFSDKMRLLYLNPPRTGLGEIVTDWILNEYRPGRIAYLSCSAGTLAKDLNKLTLEDYTVIKIIPYDFFPNTHHVETLVLIQKI